MKRKSTLSLSNGRLALIGQMTFGIVELVVEVEMQELEIGIGAGDVLLRTSRSPPPPHRNRYIGRLGALRDIG